MEKDTTIGWRRLADLFDAGTFAEVGAYIKRGDGKPSGATCGYGAIDGKLVYAFAQDADREKGAFDLTAAKKLHMLYETAVRNGAPVVRMSRTARMPWRRTAVCFRTSAGRPA